MKFIIGLIILFGCVGGGYVLSHGQLHAIWQPFEVLIIGGAAFGGFVISNPAKVIKASFKGLLAVLAGKTYSKQSFLDLLSLLYDIGMKVRKNGLMSLEGDVDNPAESPLFQPYPKILSNQKALAFMTDNLRTITSGALTPYELENLIDTELETYAEELDKPVHAIQAVSDALPGFGIVAAVLGIVITMGFIGGEAKQLGEHVGAALVGTFLGILIAYGIVGPVSSALHYVAKDEIRFFSCIKIFLVALASGRAPTLSIEFARRCLYSGVRPTFLELEEYVKNKGSAPAGGG